MNFFFAFRLFIPAFRGQWTRVNFSFTGSLAIFAFHLSRSPKNFLSRDFFGRPDWIDDYVCYTRSICRVVEFSGSRKLDFDAKDFWALRQWDLSRLGGLEWHVNHISAVSFGKSRDSKIREDSNFLPTRLSTELPIEMNFSTTIVVYAKLFINGIYFLQPCN